MKSSFNPVSISKSVDINKVSANRNIINLSLQNSNLLDKNNNVEVDNNIINVDFNQNTIKEYTLSELSSTDEKKVKNKICSTGNFVDFTDWQNVQMQKIEDLSLYKERLNEYLRKYDADGNIISEKDWTIEDIYNDIEDSELKKLLKRYIDNGFGNLVLINIRNEDGYDSVVLQDSSGNYTIVYGSTNSEQINDLLYDIYPIIEKINLEDFLKKQTEGLSIRDLMKILEMFGISGIEDYLDSIEYGKVVSLADLEFVFNKLKQKMQSVYIDHQKKAIEDYNFYANQAYKDDLKDGKNDKNIQVNLTGYSKGGDLASHVYTTVSNPTNCFFDLLNYKFDYNSNYDWKPYLDKQKDILKDSVLNLFTENSKIDFKKSMVSLCKLLYFSFAPLTPLAGMTYEFVVPTFDDPVPFTSEYQNQVDRLGSVTLLNAYTASLNRSEAQQLADDPDLKYYAVQGDVVSAIFNYNIFRQSDNFKIIYGGDVEGNPWNQNYKLKESGFNKYDRNIEIILEWINGEDVSNKKMTKVLKYFSNMTQAINQAHFTSDIEEFCFDAETGEVLDEIILDTGTVLVENVSSETILKELVGGPNPIKTIENILENMDEKTIEKLNDAIEAYERLEDDGFGEAVEHLLLEGNFDVVWNLLINYVS